MREEVSHKGKVVKMTPQLTTVAFLQHDACSGCHAAAYCGMGEMAEKLVELPTDPYAGYGVGDEVEVVLKATMGLKAVVLAYFLPLVVLLAVILGLIALGTGEVPAALAGLAAVGVYYFLLYILRGKLRNEYIFEIKG